MMKSLYRMFGAVALMLSLAGPGTAFAQIEVLSSGGAAMPLHTIIPAFEKATGLSVVLSMGKSQGNGPETIANQLRRGVRTDIVILSREGLNGLIADNRIVAHSDTDLAKTPIGVAVQAGMPKPDIATVDAVKHALLTAKSVTFTDSTIGIYLVEKLFPSLGIAKEMALKSTTVGVAAVARGEAQIAIQPMSELQHVAGTDFVGTLPAEMQYISVFSAARVAGSDNADAAKFIAFLHSAQAKEAFLASGMTPVDSGEHRDSTAP